MTRHIILLLIVLLLASKLFGQISELPNDISKKKNDLPLNIKKIVQYSDTFTSNIREYDKYRNEIFSYYTQYVNENWNGKYIYIIQGSLYNSKMKIVKSYSLHSNIGFSISFYDYDTINSINTQYSIIAGKTADSLANSNKYKCISTIDSFNDLINFNEILELENTGKKLIVKKDFFDNSNNIIKTIYFSENQDTSSITQYYYNQLGKVSHITDHHKDYKNYRYNPFESFYNYLEDGRILFLKTGYDYLNNKADTVEIKICDYNLKNQLITEFKLNSDLVYNGKRYFVYHKYSSKYNIQGLVSEQTFSETYPDNKLIPNVRERIFSKKLYKYNSEGFIIEDSDYNLISETEKHQLYNYKYEYYNENE